MQIDQSSPLILAADIGGSHITAGICNSATNRILQGSIIRVEVDSKGSADKILAAWENAFKAVLKIVEKPIVGLAVAMPGPFDYENGISYIKGLSKYESIFGMNVKSYLAGVLGLDSWLIYFRNDAESTIAGEVLGGAGENFEKVIGITLGTGFGSAFSEAKHTKDLNLGSYTYKESIADDYFSTRWFVKRYYELTGETLSGGVKELSTLTGNSELAKIIFAEFAAELALFLQKPVQQLQPQALVICGNIAKASRFFLPDLSQKLPALSIVLAQLDEDAPLIGAAAKAKNQFILSSSQLTNQ